MNSGKIWYYLRQAAELAIKQEDLRTFRLGCIGIRSDGALVQASNLPAPEPTIMAHAESRVCQKLDGNATIFVARVRGDGKLGLAKPCGKCQVLLKNKKVKKVYYTFGPGSWRSMVP